MSIDYEEELLEIEREHQRRLRRIRMQYWFLILCVVGAVFLPILLLFLLTRR